MSVSGLLPKIALIALTAGVLMACDSHNRNASPNYHINSMERLDKHAHYPQDERVKRMEKAMNKDK